MVYWVDNKTAPKVKQRKDPVFSDAVLWFADEIGKTPTIPQAAWFNMIQAELLGLAEYLDITPDKLDDNQLAIGLKAAFDKVGVDIQGLPKVLDALGESRKDAASQRIVNAVNQLAKDAQTAANISNDKANQAKQEAYEAKQLGEDNGKTLNIITGLQTFQCNNNMHKILFKTDGKYLVLTTNSAGTYLAQYVENGNVAAPSLPNRSENNSWDLYRSTLVERISNVMVSKLFDPITTSSLPAEYLPELKAISPFRYNLITVEPSASIESTVVANITGLFTLSLIKSPRSSENIEIFVNDISAVNSINMNSEDTQIATFQLQGVYGANKVTLKNKASRARSIGIIGFDLKELKNIEEHNFYDNIGIYSNLDLRYVVNKGASDYAFLSAKNNLWAGSYHGGETALVPAQFYTDKGVANIGNNKFIISKNIKIKQSNQLKWSTGESMNISSLTEFYDDSVRMHCVASNINLTAKSAHMGMTTASESFSSVMANVGIETKDPIKYDLDGSLYINQMNPVNGLSVETYFTPPSFVKSPYRGAIISVAEKAYAKVYSNVVDENNGSGVKLPSSLTWIQVHKYT